MREVYAAVLLQNVFETEEYQESFKLLRFAVCYANCLYISIISYCCVAVSAIMPVGTG